MNLFTYVKSQLSILKVVNEYTVLKRAGLYWKGTCPFHNEKTASFTVSPHKEIFYCFGCHLGGDVIAFVANIEHCTPIEAAKQLIERYGLSIPDDLAIENSSKTTEERNRYYELCKLVSLWLHQMLLKHHAPMTYLTDRNITKESSTYFTLGYFPGGPAAIKVLLSFMQSHHFLADDLIQANILAQGKTVLYSPFEERIIFPIKDHLGRFCGFGGRIFKPTDERAKYYNSRENAYFTKGNLLFGLDLAKQAIQKKESVFLVEGYTDCIAMVQHGFPNTVATLGTSCTAEHLTALTRYAQKLYVLYDGDTAGQEAMLRLTQLCWQVNLEPQVIILPRQEDPASFLKKGNDIAPFIAQAQDIFVFFIQTMGNEFATKTLNEKLRLTRKIIDIINTIDDPLKQDILLQKAATTLNIPFQSLKDALKGTKSQVHKPVVIAPTKPSESYPTLEKKIFFAIMQNIQIFNRENEEYLLEYLPEPFCTILTQLKHAKDKNPSLDFTQFFDMLKYEDQQCVSKILLEGEQDASHADFEQLLMHLQKKHWKQIVQATKVKLAQLEHTTDKEKVEKILNNFLELKKKLLHKNLST